MIYLFKFRSVGKNWIIYFGIFAGFVGHSYLVHNLNEGNKTVQDGVDIEIQFKTRHSEGRMMTSIVRWL